MHVCMLGMVHVCVKNKLWYAYPSARKVMYVCM
jgi:hypothetical protein